MAGAMIEGNTGGRRAIDAPINMIPMIDLLASMIAFLLMTAVWVHVGQVRAQQPVSHAVDLPVLAPRDHLTLTLSPDSLQLGATAADRVTVPGRARRAERLGEQLRLRHAAAPQLRDVRIQSDGAVNYQDVVEAMDVVYAVWGAGLAQGRPLSDAVNIEFL
jgi:biopolymer transport protein ExbD